MEVVRFDIIHNEELIIRNEQKINNVSSDLQVHISSYFWLHNRFWNGNHYSFCDFKDHSISPSHPYPCPHPHLPIQPTIASSSKLPVSISPSFLSFATKSLVIDQNANCEFIPILNEMVCACVIAFICCYCRQMQAHKHYYCNATKVSFWPSCWK